MSVEVFPPGQLNNDADVLPPTTPGGGGGGGTVTSVGLTMPAGYAVAGSPVVGAGVLAVTGPLTTKGDILAFGAQNDRFPVGLDGQIINADSSQTDGIKWVNIPSTSLNLEISGFKKRWRSVEGVNGSNGTPLPASSFWTHTTSGSTTSQNPTWGSAWLSIPKSLDISGASLGSAVAWTGTGGDTYALSTTNGGIGSGFYFMCRAGWHTKTATPRIFMGMRATSSLFGNVEPSTSVNCLGIACDSGDTQLSAYHNDAAGTCTKDVINGGAGFPCNTNQTDYYEVVVWAAPNQTSTINWSITNLMTGVTASGQWTTGAGDIPAANLGLVPYFWWSCGSTASAVTVAYTKVYIECNY